MMNTLFYIEESLDRRDIIDINDNSSSIEEYLEEQGRTLRKITTEEIEQIQKIFSSKYSSLFQKKILRRFLRSYSNEEIIYLASIPNKSKKQNNQFHLENKSNQYAYSISRRSDDDRTSHILQEILKRQKEEENDDVEFMFAPSSDSLSNHVETLEQKSECLPCESHENTIVEVLRLIKILDDAQLLPTLGAQLTDSVINQLRQNITKGDVQLRVDEKFRILCTDSDIVVPMPTLSKALYFLFLRHPEGIILKHISDYRDELLKIYLILTPRSMTDINYSIDSIIGLEDGSLDQKISRANHAIKANISYSDAWQITGKRGDIKKIDAASKAVLPDRLKMLR